jgi:hypothetical protein
METTQKVLDTMKAAGKALKASEIVELSGLDQKQVDKALKQLKTENKIKSPVRCFWQPS